MAIVVIGGHSRSVGKTSVVAGLIAALREYDWTAVKITQYGHGVCSANGAPCDCATDDHTWAISEEKDRGGESDTSRFLVAGAARALWVRTEQGRLAEAMPALRRRLGNIGFWLLNLVIATFAFAPPDSFRPQLEAALGVTLPSWPVADRWPSLVAAFLLLDFMNYAVHRCQHAVPFLWRFHALHHSDPDVDVTTSVRHHPIEYLMAAGFYWAAVLLLGIGESNAGTRLHRALTRLREECMRLDRREVA